ncbi:putative membrane protein [Kitasatospora gansuensis]|uniref:Putative membrane protein n=1 Tax=Kitasatospora gansuensis TaxID=258050 RepID=A0A7W7SIS9_9ACTN|nr:SRPBCC family protein [Kitasatospora gansuensis]MBB4951243.1 putative membrane protein [Kitasatospora gansuensis]
MSGLFEASVEVDRPVEEVFAYLADGRHDPEFSPRVLEITKTPDDAPTAVGTVFRSTVKDAGMKTSREFRITGVEAPRTIRWSEQSKNLITAEGGYDLEPLPDSRTRVRIFNVLEGHGLGKVLLGPAVHAARKDAPDFGRRIKAAIERS